MRRVGQMKALTGCSAACHLGGVILAQAHVVQVLQFHVGKNVEVPAAGLFLAEAAIGVSRPRPTPAAGWKYLWTSSCCRQASAICLRLLPHCTRRAASRAAWTAGNNSAIKMAMIVITTSNSTR